MQELYDESNKLYDYFQRFQIPLSRKSADESMNNYGSVFLNYVATIIYLFLTAVYGTIT